MKIFVRVFCVLVLVTGAAFLLAGASQPPTPAAAGAPSVEPLSPIVLCAAKPRHRDECCCGDCSCCGLSYRQGEAVAKRTGKPLCLWVGCCCPARERELPELVHAHTDAIEGREAPYVAVLRYEEGRFAGGRGFRTIPTLEQLVSAASGGLTAAKPRVAQPAFAPAFAPAFFPMPAVGGCGPGACGGCCSGGCCCSGGGCCSGGCCGR